MKIMRAFGVVLGISAFAAGLLAEEGMWMPQQIPEMAAKLKALGFKGDAKSFADLSGQPMGAIVSLGGCTASFVSPDGLIVTNHHCVTGGLQFNSTPTRNLLKDGYLAKTRGEELQNGPGSRVWVTSSVTEVTREITGNIDAKASDRARYDLIERRLKERVAACEKSGQRCTVGSFFSGLRYFEIAQMEIKDVRLVYAPAEGIGVFGGETDNWRWPRHTGDWSFLRAYVGKDGKPAVYSKDNVPFKPVHWLKVSAEGVKPGDLVFVAGYPGRTQRHQTYAQVKETAEWSMPRSIRLAEEQLAIIDQLTRQDKAIALKLAGRIQGLNNTLTNQKGMLEGLVKGGSLELKRAREKALAAWIDSDPARQQEVRRRAAGAARAAGGEREDAGAERGDGDPGERVHVPERGADDLPAVGGASRSRTWSGKRVSRSATCRGFATGRIGCSGRWMRRPTGRCWAGRWDWRRGCRKGSGWRRWIRRRG